MTVGTPNRESSLFIRNSDIRNATPVERPKKRPKKPARSSGSGYRIVAALENGRYSEKNSREKRIDASASHRISRDLETYLSPSLSCSSGSARSRRRAASDRSVPASSAMPRATDATSVAIQTRSRLDVPSHEARGFVTSPPTT